MMHLTTILLLCAIRSPGLRAQEISPSALRSAFDGSRPDKSESESRVSVVAAAGVGSQVEDGKSKGLMVNPRWALFPSSPEARRKFGRVSVDLGVGVSVSEYRDKTVSVVESRNGAKEVVRETTRSINDLNVLETPGGLNYRSPSWGPFNVELGKRLVYFYSEQPRDVQTLRRIERDAATGATRVIEERELSVIYGKDPGIGHTTYGALNVQVSRNLALRAEASRIQPLKSTDGDRARGMTFRFGITGGW